MHQKKKAVVKWHREMKVLTLVLLLNSPIILADDCSPPDRTFNTHRGYKEAGQKLAQKDEKLAGTGERLWYHPTKFRYRSTAGFGVKHTVATGHEGTDIVDKMGSPIYSASKGVVVYTLTSCRPRRSGFYDRYCGNGWGNHIVVYHGKNQAGEHIYTRYGHLNEVLVSEGQSVQGNELIATMGHSGASETPHLHFELGKTVDRKIKKCEPPQNFAKVYNPMLLKFQKSDSKFGEVETRYEGKVHRHRSDGKPYRYHSSQGSSPSNNTKNK